VSQSVEVKLYVGNLAAATNENALRQLFSQSGTVTSVHLIKDRNTGQSKGFAFVTMSSVAGAQKAVAKLHGFALAGRPLAVNIAEQPKAPAAGYQSRLSAFSVTDRSPKVNSLNPGKTGGYQSKLGAFGAGSRPPAPSRRKGGNNQRH
jgi:RNA recognition motif-containing protein